MTIKEKSIYICDYRLICKVCKMDKCIILCERAILNLIVQLICIYSLRRLDKLINCKTPFRTKEQILHQELIHIMCSFTCRFEQCEIYWVVSQQDMSCCKRCTCEV